MLRNYLKIAFRNLKRYKMYSFINIAGLAIGMACAILIFKWVQNELSYDNFVKDSASIYRVNWSYKWNGQEGVAPTTPPPLAAKLEAEVPEVNSTTRLYPIPSLIGRHGDNFFNEDNILGVDPDFFRFFSFRLLAGDPKTALSSPNSVVLTESEAKKYFGDESPVGKMIELGDNKKEFKKQYNNLFKVTGVVQDPPENSTIQFDMLTSISSYPAVSFFNWSWIWMNVVTYARIEPGSSMPLIETKVKQIVAKYAPAAFHRVGFSYKDLIKNGGRWDFTFQPLKDIYLGSSEIGNRLGPIGNRSYIYAFSLISIFILLIACVNFMNLSTARSERRATEVGIRKTLGSSRNTLFTQFVTESIMFSLMALPVALLIVESFLGSFDALVGKSLSINLLSSTWTILLLFALALIVGLAAGSYPGVYLASLRPSQILKGTKDAGSGGRRFRSVLTVFQFAISIGLIVCTLLVQKQMGFIKNANLGFNKENVVVISNVNNPLGNQLEAFKEKVKSYPQVIDVSVTTGLPPDYGFEDYYKVPGKGDKQVSLSSYMTDQDFIKTLDIHIKQGRGFQKDHPTDADAVILNETAVKKLGIKDPVGKKITYPSRGKYTIIDVMKDFNFLDLHSPIMPFALFNRKSNSYQIPDSYIIVRLKGHELVSGISRLESTWKSFTSKTPFNYSFLDQNLAQQYTSERNLEKIFLIFSLLAIFIAALGLFGLTTFVTERRTKEIGVRKVLGASVAGIVALLSKDFLKLVGIGFLIAVPVGWYAMHRWLENFAYHISIGVGTFALAGVVAMVIALATVSWQSVKAAIADPVKSLRNE